VSEGVRGGRLVGGSLGGFSLVFVRTWVFCVCE
jgi:hypothetical protein